MVSCAAGSRFRARSVADRRSGGQAARPGEAVYRGRSPRRAEGLCRTPMLDYDELELGPGFSQVQSQTSDKRTWRALGTVSRGGGAILGPVNRNTTPSRSILQTVASTAPGRKCGERKYRRPFVPSLNGSGGRTLTPSGLKPPRGHFIQPSRYSSGKSMTDHVADIVPATNQAFAGTYPVRDPWAVYDTSQHGSRPAHSVATGYPGDTDDRSGVGAPPLARGAAWYRSKRDGRRYSTAPV